MKSRERETNRKTVFSSALMGLLLLLAFSHLLSAQAYAMIANPSHLIVESIGDPETVDPAWAYDTASLKLIGNVYETLIRTDPENSGSFLPVLATDWWIVDINEIDPITGINYLQRVTFKIRLTNATGQPIKFHDGSTLTTEDVEYSFERCMVQDRSGGPTWMISEAVYGVGIYRADLNDPLQDEKIDHAVMHNATHVWFNLAVRYAPFLGILAQPWASIVPKSWAITNGDWTHDWSVWKDYHDPGVSPLDWPWPSVTCGTGPYKLNYWQPGIEWSLIRFVDYWRGWPYEPLGYLERVTVKLVYEWSTRLADFKAGVADIVYVPRQYKSQVESWPGILGFKDIPTLSVDAMFFNFNVDPASPYVRSGQLDGNGIPRNFFSDVHIRRGFAYLFDYNRFINEVWLGEATQPSSPIIEEIPYHIDVDKYYFSLTKAAEEFQTASADPSSPAYDVWNKGFKLMMTYNYGNILRQTAAQMLRTNAQLVNSKFIIETAGVAWSTYLGELWWYPSFRSIMPLIIMGWQADYIDPHNFVMPFMHSKGYFAYPTKYYNPTVNSLIDQGISTSDGTERAAVYEQLQWLYYQEIPSVCLAQPLARHWERDWVQGWHYNPLLGGSSSAIIGDESGLNFYDLWKGPPDSTPPTTTDDYDDLWHNTDFAIALTASDDLRGIEETHYKINDSPTQGVSIHGQPYITTEDANNKLEYWSVDRSHNEETPHHILTGIKLDKTKPFAYAGPDQSIVQGATMIFDGSACTDNVGIAGYTWTFTDQTVKTLKGMNPSYVFNNIGNFEVALNVSDCAGNWDTDNMWVNVSPQTLEAFFDTSPDTLNLKSKGKWITGYIQLPEGYSAADINASTILLNETVSPVLDSKYGWVKDASGYLVDYNNDGVLERMAKFDRATVESWIYHTQRIKCGNIALTMTGELLDGTQFAGTDTIFVNYCGDANNDGKINIADLVAVKAHWYPGPPTGSLCYDINADFNQDGAINTADIVILKANWGQTTP